MCRNPPWASWIKALIQFPTNAPNLAAGIPDALNQVDELRAERNVLVHGFVGNQLPPGPHWCRPRVLSGRKLFGIA